MSLRWETKKSSAVFISAVVLVLTVCQPVSGQAPKISKRQAQALISTHCSDYYAPFRIGETKYPVTEMDEFNMRKEELDRWERSGLVKYDILKSPVGLYLSVVTAVTEKGKENGAIRELENPQNVGLFMGRREILNIEEVVDGNTVTFTCRFLPTEAAYKTGFYEREEEYTSRYKARIEYDPFLEKFVFNGLITRGLSDEEWKDATWIDLRDGEKVCITGVNEY